MDSREKILSRIKTVIANRPKKSIEDPGFSKPVQIPVKGNLLDNFLMEFEENLGKAYLYNDLDELTKLFRDFLARSRLKSIHCIDPELQSVLMLIAVNFSSEKKDFLNMDAGVTSCEYLISSTGSIMVSSSQASGRSMNVYPPCHIVFAKKSQLVPEICDALSSITQKYGKNLPSFISTITGPSRTADIEKTLVMGAHGPKELVLFIDHLN